MIDGGAGNDTLTGGLGDDEIVTGTGDDIVNGGAGSDYITVGANLTAADQINGGSSGELYDSEIDTLELSGSYASYVTLGAATIVNVERFLIRAGQIKLAVNAATNVRTVDASSQLQTDSLWFNGSAATNAMTISGGAGADRITGGAGNDSICLLYTSPSPRDS